MPTDPLDVEPHDPEQLDEIDMVSNLMIVCSQCPERRLPRDVLDAVLGVPVRSTSDGSGGREHDSSNTRSKHVAGWVRGQGRHE